MVAAFVLPSTTQKTSISPALSKHLLGGTHQVVDAFLISSHDHEKIKKAWIRNNSVALKKSKFNLKSETRSFMREKQNMVKNCSARALSPGLWLLSTYIYLTELKQF